MIRSVRTLFFGLLFGVVTALSASAQSSTRTEIGQAALDGKPIILLSDGLWRYDDAIGEICTPVYISGKVCALPSEWSVFPYQEPGMHSKLRPIFLSDDGFFAEMDSMGAPGVRVHTDMEDIANFVLSRVESHSRSKVRQLTFHRNVVDDRLWFTASTLTARGPEIVSFTESGDMVIIGVTIEPDTSLVLEWHKRKHAEFLRALRFE